MKETDETLTSAQLGDEPEDSDLHPWEYDEEEEESDMDPREPEIDPLADTDRIQKAIEKAVDDETAALPLLSNIKEPEKENEENVSSTRIHHWFFTFMCIKIPIVSWIYLLYLAFNKKTTDRRDFARAYLFYKLVFLAVSIIILGALFYIGMGLLDQLLAYMEML